jgi:hypothetical protein
MNAYIKKTNSTKSTKLKLKSTKSTQSKPKTTKSTQSKMKSTKSIKSTKLKRKQGGTPYIFPSIFKFYRDYKKKNSERLKPMSEYDRQRLIAKEWKEEKDRIRSNYVYKNFKDLNEIDKKKLIENLKKAEEFTKPKQI